MEFLDKIQKNIDINNMIKNGDKVIAGISGGADSICLLEVLYRLRKKYNIEITAVHVNHGIRGKEADEDEEFVRRLCLEKEIDFRSLKVIIGNIAKERKVTEEEAGRQIRYEFFESIVKEKIESGVDCESCKIAIAHNMNDNGETMLFNLFRGTGITGIAGIPPINGKIIRPLLVVTRDNIEEYLNQIGRKFRIDRTNLSDEYSRNRIRHNVLEYAVNNINSKTVEHMSNTAKILRETEEFVKQYAQDKYNQMKDKQNIVFKADRSEYIINIEAILEEDIIIQKHIIRLIIFNLVGKLKDIESVHIDSIVELFGKQVGRTVMLPYNIVAKKDYLNLIIRCDEEKSINCEDNNDLEKNSEFQLEIGKKYYIPQIGMYLETELKIYVKNNLIPKNNYTKWFDYDKIYNVILIRNRRTGDFMQISPLGQKKKLKDIFINEKISKEKRDLLPLLADGSHIIWVLGGRNSEAYRVDKNTKRILEVRLIQEN